MPPIRDDQLPAIVYWMMGSLGAVDLKQLKGAAPAILIGVGALTLAGRALDALSMGDDEARSLGVPVHATRYGVIATATLVSSLSVSLAGMIGWVGLVVPHVARLAIGPTNSKLLPASALLGASFLIAADSVARNITRAEYPDRRRHRIARHSGLCPGARPGAEGLGMRREAVERPLSDEAGRGKGRP